jgi:aryl-alcohol dehydrogenase-like predicted oxidoreductase
MRYCRLGKTELNVSIIGFGCNQIGSGNRGYKEFGAAKDAIFHAIDEGVNYFDTADVYGDRRSEEWLGEILGSERKRTIISTKAGLTGDGGRNGHPDHLKCSLENSLKKLKTDYVDIFYLHRKDPEVPLVESLGAINELVQEGKVRFGGISQLDLEDLETVKNNSTVSCVQYCLNFFNYQTVYAVMPAIKAMRYGLSTYSPMASGWIFKKKYYRLKNNKFSFLCHRYYRPEFPVYKEVSKLADEFGMKINQLALNWILSHHNVDSVILGASSWDQLHENIKSLEVETPLELITRLNGIIQMNMFKKHSIRNIVWNTGLKAKKLLNQIKVAMLKLMHENLK